MSSLPVLLFQISQSPRLSVSSSLRLSVFLIPHSLVKFLPMSGLAALKAIIIPVTRTAICLKGVVMPVDLNFRRGEIASPTRKKGYFDGSALIEIDGGHKVVFADGLPDGGT